MSVRIDRVKLIAEMARQDMTVNKLVELSGLSRVTVTGIRSGKSCSRATADKLATKFKIIGTVTETAPERNAATYFEQ